MTVGSAIVIVGSAIVSFCVTGCTVVHHSVFDGCNVAGIVISASGDDIQPDSATIVITNSA